MPPESQQHRAVHDVGSFSTETSATPTLPGALGTDAEHDDTLAPVLVVDTPMSRVRQPRDLVNVVVAGVGAILVLVLAVYAHATTEGVQADVQNFGSVLAQVLFVPVALLEALIMLGVPVAVLTEIAIRRQGRQVVECIAALVTGLTLAALATWAIATWGSDELQIGMSVPIRGVYTLTIPGFIAGVGGLLTASGPRTRRRTVRLSWNLLWVSLTVVLVTGQVSLSGVLFALLLGRLAGMLVRYVSGVRSERAYGQDLLDGVRRAGFEPTALIRVRDVADDDEPVDAYDRVSDEEASARALAEGTELAPGPSSVAITRYSDNRVYALSQDGGPRLDVVVLDGDRQVIGVLTRLWRSLRLRGIDGRSAISLRAVAERAALLAYAAQSAGVRSPRLLGLAEADDSMLLIQEHAVGTMPLRDVPTEKITDKVLRDAWRQLEIAHAAGLAHRQLTADVLLLGTSESGEPEVWLTGWESGDVASSTLARRMDLTQLIALLALRVGAERAMASAAEVLSDTDIEALGPLLQVVALPTSTREEVRKHKEVITDLRQAFVDRLPEADVQPVSLVRFGARTIITLVLTVVAVFVVLTTINFEEIREALLDAQPWWALVAFALGVITWVGSAVTFVAFAPVRLSVFRATAVQAAASFVALAAPAGLGPAALNLRMLTKRGVSTSLALATVALVQVSQFVVTVLLLVGLSVATGDGGVLRSLPSTTMLAAFAIAALVVASAFMVPWVRRWVISKLEPMYRQVWPRLSEMLGQPWRIALGFAGNIVMTMGYVLAFDAALAAFGQDVALVDVAVVYLVGNTAGALVPTPGGLGAIEFALITGLTATAGVPASIATPAVALFRVVTYWARIPIGWVAMRYLQRKGDL